MKLSEARGDVTLTLGKAEALVLFEMLQRLVEENENRLLPLLKSSAEFAVLCRLSNHLEKTLAEPFFDNYEELLNKARHEIIKQSGHYVGINEE